MAEGMRLGEGETGVGVFSDPLYIFLGFILIVVALLIFKNFDKITDFIFKK
jgi:hypothetical protein